MPKQAERLFLALAVDEISMVDEGANEKEYIVAKRKEQTEMTTAALSAAAEQTDDSSNAAAQEAVAKATEVVETELDDGTPDEVVDALKNLVGNAIAVATAKQAVAKPKGGDDKGGKPPFLKAMEEKLKGMGLDKATIGKVLSAAKASFGSSGLKTPEPEMKGTKKSAEGEDEPAAAAAEVDTDELVLKTLEAISKAKSFTPGRIKKLVQAINSIDSVLTELGIDKASFGASGIAATGTSGTPMPSAMDAAGTGGPGKPANTIRKDAGGEASGLTAEGIAAAVAKALEPVTEKLGEVAGRVDAIEKARTPSTQPKDGEPGDGEQVQKNNRLWSGIL